MLHKRFTVVMQDLFLKYRLELRINYDKQKIIKYQRTLKKYGQYLKN